MQTEIVYRSIPDALLQPCKVVQPTIYSEDGGMYRVTYEDAFYAVSEAYLDTTRSVSLCNDNIREAIRYNNRLKDGEQKERLPLSITQPK